MTKLTDGMIPPHTECPSISKCKLAGTQGQCSHEGEQHEVAFSCALARAFDLMDEETR